MNKTRNNPVKSQKVAAKPTTTPLKSGAQKTNYGPSLTIRFPFDGGTVLPDFVADGSCSPHSGGVVVRGRVFDNALNPVSHELQFVPNNGSWSLGPFLDQSTGMPLAPGTYTLIVILDDGAGGTLANHAIQITIVATSPAPPPPSP